MFIRRMRELRAPEGDKPAAAAPDNTAQEIGGLKQTVAQLQQQLSQAVGLIQELKKPAPAKDDNDDDSIDILTNPGKVIAKHIAPLKKEQAEKEADRERRENKQRVAQELRDLGIDPKKAEHKEVWAKMLELDALTGLSERPGGVEHLYTLSREHLAASGKASRESIEAMVKDKSRVSLGFSSGGMQEQAEKKSLTPEQKAFAARFGLDEKGYLAQINANRKGAR